LKDSLIELHFAVSHEDGEFWPGQFLALAHLDFFARWEKFAPAIQKTTPSQSLNQLHIRFHFVLATTHVQRKTKMLFVVVGQNLRADFLRHLGQNAVTFAL